MDLSENRYYLTKFIMLLMACSVLHGLPPNIDDYRYYEKELSTPGAHQLASWRAFQLRPRDFISPPADFPSVPYRLPLNGGKRNSEVANAMIASEDAQKMYREG